jgi:hypothetical protein
MCASRRFLNGKILYRGRSAQRFRDPAFLGIVNPDNDADVVQGFSNIPFGV